MFTLRQLLGGHARCTLIQPNHCARKGSAARQPASWVSTGPALTCKPRLLGSSSQCSREAKSPKTVGASGGYILCPITDCYPPASKRPGPRVGAQLTIPCHRSTPA